MPRPYQPSLLRLLHTGTGLLAIAAWCSGLMVYSLHDGRWGRLPFTPGGDWIDLHGSLAVALLPLAVLFGAYAVSIGRSRLADPATVLALGALGLAIGSGKAMQEDWLRQGQLDHWIYGLHLLGWLLLALAVGLHVALVLRRGGLPLAASMLQVRLRRGDRPGDWPGQIRAALGRR
jgi:Prokaryotic cytochrome b561